MKNVVTIALLFLLSACAQVVRLNDFEERPPSKKVDVYSEKSAVKKGYKEMAILSFSTVKERTRFSVEQLKDEAKKIGADAIILWHPAPNGVDQVIAISYTE